MISTQRKKLGQMGVTPTMLSPGSKSSSATIISAFIPAAETVTRSGATARPYSRLV